MQRPAHGEGEHPHLGDGAAGVAAGANEAADQAQGPLADEGHHGEERASSPLWRDATRPLSKATARHALLARRPTRLRVASGR